jgi:predicted amidohydrolase
LNTILISLSENGAKYYYNVGIEKKDDKFFFVYDKISYLFTYGELLKNAKTEDEKKIFQSKIARATTLISAIRCPILMVKK